MNIREAIRSGKPYKRKCWKGYVNPRFPKVWHREPTSTILRNGREFERTTYLTPQDILADDYELQPEVEVKKDLRIRNLEHALKVMRYQFGKLKRKRVQSYGSDDEMNLMEFIDWALRQK